MPWSAGARYREHGFRGLVAFLHAEPARGRGHRPIAYLRRDDASLGHAEMPRAVQNVIGDVTNYAGVLAVMQQYEPEVVFHLAAQALVLPSYENRCQPSLRTSWGPPTS